MHEGGLWLFPAVTEITVHATNRYRENNVWIKGATSRLFICQNGQALKVDMAGLDGAWLNFNQGPFN